MKQVSISEHLEEFLTLSWMNFLLIVLYVLDKYNTLLKGVRFHLETSGNLMGSISTTITLTKFVWLTNSFLRLSSTCKWAIHFTNMSQRSGIICGFRWIRFFSTLCGITYVLFFRNMMYVLCSCSECLCLYRSHLYGWRQYLPFFSTSHSIRNFTRKPLTCINHLIRKMIFHSSCG